MAIISISVAILFFNILPEVGQVTLYIQAKIYGAATESLPFGQVRKTKQSKAVSCLRDVEKS